MRSKRCSIKNCGNTVTTASGTYTFYNEEITKDESAKLCKKHGGIIAPLNNQEEFDAVHKFAYKCQPWCSHSVYHTGLYLVRNETRFYSDCTEWDWEKHDKLYDSYIEEGPCWDIGYMPYNKIQEIFANEYCVDRVHRTICFNTHDKNIDEEIRSEQEELRLTNHAEGFDRLTTLSVFIALATLTVGLAVALVRSRKKNTVYEEKFSL